MEENSEKKPEAPVLAPGHSLVLVKNQPNKEGVVTFREVEKDEHGKYIKKVKPLPATVEFVRSRRKRLLQTNEDGVTADMQIMEELLEIINMPIDGYFNSKGQSLPPDGKLAMAKIKAAEAIWLYTLGKPAPSEQEMDLLKHAGVRLVIVEPPPLDTPTQAASIEEKKTQPSFAEVLSVDTDPQK